MLKTSRNGTPISHLLFVDDLLLFGEASVHQAKCMEKVLSSFCNISGQRVNLAKSIIWYSSNTTRDVKSAISSAVNVSISKTLGVYLGVSCLHSRVTRNTFDKLVLKVRHGWWGGGGQMKIL